MSATPRIRSKPARARATAMLLLACLVAATSPAHGQPAGCSYPAAFPGENAGAEAIAAWMAARAIERGLPGELPVIAALVRPLS